MYKFLEFSASFPFCLNPKIKSIHLLILVLTSSNSKYCFNLKTNS